MPLWWNLVDTRDLGSRAVRRESSSLLRGTQRAMKSSFAETVAFVLYHGELAGLTVAAILVVNH